MQIEDTFKDPEDRFWEKKSSEGILGILKYSRTPLLRTRLIQSPRYFEVVFLSLHLKSTLIFRNCQQQTPKRPTKKKVRQAIETLSRYSLFAVEGPEIRGQTSQLSLDKSIRKKTKQSTQRFFNTTASAEVIRHIITAFLFNQCLSSNCTVFYLKKMFHCYEFYASPVILKSRYFKLFPISLGTLTEIAGFNCILQIPGQCGSVATK